jgi:hypothetical protein
MRARPPEFLHSLSLRKLRKDLQETCQAAMRLSRNKVAGQETKLNFTGKDYLELQKRRDKIIDKIRTIWNMEEIR